MNFWERNWIARFLAFAVFATTALLAKANQPQPAAGALGEESLPSRWWHGDTLLPRWQAAEQKGVQFRGFWRSAIFGVPAGGLEQRTVMENEVRLGLQLELESIVGWQGASLTGSVRWRDGENPANLVGSYGVFAPSPYQSGKGWRLMPFFATWENASKSLLLRAGFINPYEFFLQMPLSTVFMNSAFSATKGLTGTGIPWSSSYASWGGYAQVRPARDWFVRLSASVAIPGQSDTRNHGLNFAAPGESGLYFVGETEWRREWFRDSFGAALPGRIGAGAAFFGIQRESFDGDDSFVPHSFYAFAEQMLWREAGEVRAVQEGKKASGQGLYGFAITNFSSPDYAALPFFVATGLVYEGLVPGRPKDLCGVALAWGEYSHAAALAAAERGISRHAQNEGVLEWDYRVVFNRWSYLAPFVQYAINPSGTGAVRDSLLLGVNFRAEL